MMIQNKKQQGSVLLISLALLVVLTLMTFTMSNTVLLQEKMVTSNRDDALALQVAESALRDAERFAKASLEADYTVQGNQGLYNGDCSHTDAACYLKELMGKDIFSDDYWKESNSREAGATVVECNNGAACPLRNPDRYQPGRFKIILLNKEFEGANPRRDRSTMVDNQYQSRGEGADPKYFLYKVIATGQGVNGENRRVLVSHFAAPAP